MRETEQKTTGRFQIGRTDARPPRHAGCALGLLLLSITLPAAAESPSSRVREYVRVVDRPFLRVGLTVTVTDRRGHPVGDLSRDEFRVLEDGVEMELQDFGLEGGRVDRPLSVAVLLDLSRSMGSQIRKVREAARALIEGMREGDEVMVARFNQQLTVLMPFTGDPGSPAKALSRLGRARGGTALFRALGEVVRDLRTRKGRKVILVVSDGLDNDIARDQHVLRSLFLQDLLRLCFRTETVVYGIRPGISASSWLPFEGFVEETGGRLLFSGGDLEHLFGRLAEGFKSQYYLAYDIDPKKSEGRRRRIRVEVTRPDVVVKAMRGYETPPSHVEVLIADLEDDDVGLRADAAYELGFLGDARAVPALERSLEDDDGEVRRLAIGSLVMLEATGAIPLIVRRLGDGVARVSAAAEDALMMFGPDAISHLVERVARGAGRRRTNRTYLKAVRVLGRVGDDRAVPALAAILEDSPWRVRTEAACALGDLGLSEGIPPLRAALIDDSRTVRREAVRSIVAIAGRDARLVIEAYLAREKDPALRSAARALLERR
ncbi:MAG: VWA domain-containing protein [Acidobacteria bacterium]|nr:VWA domain-containing protein [Acidobacteriota bacterium]